MIEGGDFQPQIVQKQGGWLPKKPAAFRLAIELSCSLLRQLRREYRAIECG